MEKGEGTLTALLTTASEAVDQDLPATAKAVTSATTNSLRARAKKRAIGSGDKRVVDILSGDFLE